MIANCQISDIKLYLMVGVKINTHANFSGAVHFCQSLHIFFLNDLWEKQSQEDTCFVLMMLYDIADLV